MAMIKCPECGKDVSDKASACPNCGVEFEIEQEESQFKDDSVLSIVAFVLSFVSIFVLSILGIAGFICAFIDICLNNRDKRHRASWFAILIVTVIKPLLTVIL